MGKYTVPPYTPENDASPAFDQTLIPASDPGGENLAKAKIIGRKLIKSKDEAFSMEKRAHGGTRVHQKNGWIKGR